MLVRFNNEVLRRGSEATKPHNLPSEWLELLADEARVYLSGRTDRRYILLALIASRAMARGSARTVSGVYDLTQLDDYVRGYALSLLDEVGHRSRLADRQTV